MPVDRDSCRRLWRFSDSCYGGYGAGGQQAGRSHRLRTNRYEYSVTDKPWARQQLIYHGTGIHGLRCAAAVCEAFLYYHENSCSSQEGRESTRALNRLYAF